MNWRKKIVSQFVKNAGTKVWAVSDPDRLVRNEQIMSQLQSDGFECLFYEDPVEFRYEYESRIRRAWERGDELPLVLLFDERVEGFDALPSDLLHSAARLELSLQYVFPDFDTGVVRQIPIEQWDKLSDHAERNPRRSFSRRDTEELVLRLCYQLAPDLIDSVPELFRRIFDLHRSHPGLPESLSERFEADLRQNGEFGSFKIKKLCSEPGYFWAYTDRQWQSYLKASLGLIQKDEVPEPCIPFEDPLLRGYVDLLIHEGRLQSIDPEGAAIPEGAWWRIGLKVNSGKQSTVSKEDLDALREGMPAEDANSRDWIQYAVQYSKVASLVFREPEEDVASYFWSGLWTEMDSRFSQWQQHYYGGLHNLPASPPVMQHHIPKQLNRFQMKGQRVALLLLDGLSLAGWFTAFEKLKGELSAGIQVETSGVFSWLPSLTPICRQATFAGQPPRLMEDTITRTDKDGSRWKAFWEANAGLRPKQIAHFQHKGNPDEADLDEDLTAGSVALGLTVEKPDKIMHGASLGWTGWHQQIELWAGNGYLSRLINQLISSGYVVCITADHGNLEAQGTGKISEGVLAESRGQRTRIYSNEALRNSTLAENPDTATGLSAANFPGKHYPLFAKGRGAFITEGDIIVAHGGASLDEIIVPWVVLQGGEQ